MPRTESGGAPTLAEGRQEIAKTLSHRRRQAGVTTAPAVAFFDLLLRPALRDYVGRSQ